MDESRIPAIHPVKFWSEFEDNPDKPGEKIKVDWVAWVKKGDASGAITQSKITRLQPRKSREGAEIVAIEWAAVSPAYDAWKASEEPPENGTPLIAWPGCNDSLCEALKKLHILTVEDFVGAPEHSFRGLPIANMRYLREQASAFLLAQGEVSQVASELAKRDAEIEDLKNKVESLLAENRALKPADKTAGKAATPRSTTRRKPRAAAAQS